MTALIDTILTVVQTNITGNTLLLFTLTLLGIFMILIYIRLEKWALLIIPLPLIITFANMGIPNGWFKYVIFMALGIFWFIMLANILKN